MPIHIIISFLLHFSGHPDYTFQICQKSQNCVDASPGKKL